MIIFGSRRRKSFMGRMQFPCPQCRQLSFHRIESSQAHFTLFFVPVIPLASSTVSRCEVCGHRAPVDPLMANSWFPPGAPPQQGQMYGGSPYGAPPQQGQMYGGGSPYGVPPQQEQMYGASPYGVPPPQQGQMYGASPYGASPYGASPYGAPPQQGQMYGGASPYGIPPQQGQMYGAFPQQGQAMPFPTQSPFVGVGPRFLATFLDVGVFFIFLIIISLIFSQIPEVVGYLSTLGIIAYYIVMEALWGATLGKMALKLRIVHIDGSPIGWSEALIRTLLRIVDGLFFYLLGAIIINNSFQHQRLGDMAAKTVVIRRSPPLVHQ